MKILYITPGCFDKGGISRYSRYQITALRELFEQENVKVFSILGKDKFSFEDHFSVTWVAGGISTLHKLRLVYKTLVTCIRWKPDVIHVAHINLSGVCYIISKIIRAKLVLNIYGLEVWSGLSRDAKFGLKRAFKIISDCYFTKNYIVQENLKHESDIEVIWDCVDLSKFSVANPNPQVCQKYGIPDPQKFKMILTLGRLSNKARHKGYERLVSVFAKLTKTFPDLFLVFAGEGDFRPNLEKLAVDYEMHEKVIFTGAVDESDLPDVYRSAYLFSLISDRGSGRGEGIPLTPLEAMACGIPILVGNQDGSQEAVIENNGIVLDPTDLGSHVKWISHIIKNTEAYHLMKTNAIQVSKNYFSYPSFKEKHASFYKFSLKSSCYSI